MPLKGLKKEESNFVFYRMKHQPQVWGERFRQVNTEHIEEVTEEWAAKLRADVGDEIAATVLDPTLRFRSEVRPTRELWFLYIGVERELSPEERERGVKPKSERQKKEQESPVEPIKTRYLPGRFNDEGYLKFEHWLYARDQARKDLLWLNIEVLGNTKVTPSVHQVVCDQFIQKNFDGVYKEGYTLDTMQAAIRRQNRVPRMYCEATKNYVSRSQADLDDDNNYQRFMILLDPRAFFKSTINRADTIQWILNCPDISMMIMTAANDLAATFVIEIKKQFFLALGAKPKTLHLLFPEYILRGVKGTSAEPLACPARIHPRPYATLWSDSIDSTLSGWHCDVLKFDDVVSNTNCNTDATRVKLRDQIDNTLNLVDTWGKIDMLGTRYFPDDYYGNRWIKKLDDPENAGIKFFVRAAWTVKPEYAHIADKNIRELTEDMVVLTFPDPENGAPFKKLRGQLVNNEKTFRCQQLNEPVWGDNFLITFKIEDLKAHLMNSLEAKRIPGETYIFWDTAKEAKKSSDYTAGVAAKIFQRHEDQQIAVVILEVVFGRWTQTDTVYNMVEFNNKWQPKMTQVEDSGGLELMKLRVISESKARYGTVPNMWWKPTSNEENAKRNRIKSLEVLLKTDRLYFAVGPWLDVEDGVFPQLTQYTGVKSTRTKKDDIPDAMSYICRLLPSSTPLTAKEQNEKNARDEQLTRDWLLWANHDRIFNSGPSLLRDQFAQPANNSEPESSPYSGIAGKLFGGNGLRA
jgi:hypothetical protein